MTRLSSPSAVWLWSERLWPSLKASVAGVSSPWVTGPPTVTVRTAMHDMAGPVRG
jgi:hypothetical protein